MSETMTQLDLLPHEVSVPVMPCPRCGTIDTPRLGPGCGPHAARATCAHCGAFMKWLARGLVEGQRHEN
jgi:hypothetical protein